MVVAMKAMWMKRKDDMARAYTLYNLVMSSRVNGCMETLKGGDLDLDH